MGEFRDALAPLDVEEGPCAYEFLPLSHDAPYDVLPCVSWALLPSSFSRDALLSLVAHDVASLRDVCDAPDAQGAHVVPWARGALHDIPAYVRVHVHARARDAPCAEVRVVLPCGALLRGVRSSSDVLLSSSII